MICIGTYLYCGVLPSPPSENSFTTTAPTMPPIRPLTRLSLSQSPLSPLLKRAMSTSITPVEDTIRQKVAYPPSNQRLDAKYLRLTDRQISSSLSPSTLTIRNDSHLHAHHEAMQGVASKETHFLLVRSNSIHSSPVPSSSVPQKADCS